MLRAAAPGLDTLVEFTPGLDRTGLDRTTFTRLRSVPGSGLTVAADSARLSSNQQAQTSNAWVTDRGVARSRGQVLPR